ncbi:MAG TPA: glycosyltransferase family 4 protein [Haliscomenobacter sp.]|uniref:glycosyltransferase family 4 protein n=1 Tax=Haliscomenobacter sp. TaxID=2717303 RepID=UPI002C0FD625|nr:glycosyltransferase family 4 protein [Haliscomenobacter sp.]HOY18054.1 glycosyltransferase family 4 protein [Haliscomenobacter sp.]HPH17657.1 glycosyltransferase family 4 protein [Haliscomenobacter sp.]
MKILFMHTFYRDRGGEEVLVETEMALLEEAGFEVELLAFRNPTNFLDTIFSLLFLPFNVLSFFKTINKISSFRPDVVHLHNWHFAASPSVVVACHLLKVPIVLSLHNFRLICPSATLFYQGEIFLESLKQHFPWKAVKLGVYRNSVVQTFLLAFTIYLHKKLGTWQNVRAFVVNSEFEKNTFLQSTLGITEEKLFIKANSLPEPIIDAGITGKDHFLFIGRLVPEKGIEVILDAFANTDFPLVLYGYGPLEQEVQAFAERHPNIQFKGSLPHERMSDELSNCTALIFPSTWFEGMPMTLLHAFSTGTPVIASNIGAMSTMVINQHNGLHFEVGNSQDLAQKLAYWVALPEPEKEAFRLRSRQSYASNYTPQANLKSLKSVYWAVKTNEYAEN